MAGTEQTMRGYSIKEAAGLIGIAVSTFYLMIGKGTAPPVTKVGHRSVVWERDILEWMDNLPRKQS